MLWYRQTVCQPHRVQQLQCVCYECGEVTLMRLTQTPARCRCKQVQAHLHTEQRSCRHRGVHVPHRMYVYAHTCRNCLPTSLQKNRG